MKKSQRTQYETLKTFTKQQINGLTKLLASRRFDKNTERRDEIDSLCENMLEYNDTQTTEVADKTYEVPVYHFKKYKKITKEQTVLGKNYLKDYFYKLDGTPRGGKRTQDLPSGVLDLANKVTRFEFIGVIGLTNWYGEELNYAPIYRAYNSKGEYFDYSPQHWAAPIITNVYRLPENRNKFVLDGSLRIVG